VTDLVVFTGLPASGKTTLYRERFAATHVHVSKDLWPNGRKKEDRQRQLIAEHLRANRSVVVDNTNPAVTDRLPLVAIGRDHGAHVVSYAFVTDIGDAIIRNASRQGRACVPPVAIYAVAKRLVLPSASEGFDQRFEVRLVDKRFVMQELP
jgi:predicted kinase